jgi:dihydroxyacetone kinase
MAIATPTQVMKKFINDPADVVKESLAGLAAAPVSSTSSRTTRAMS